MFQTVSATTASEQVLGNFLFLAGENGGEAGGVLTAGEVSQDVLDSLQIKLSAQMVNLSEEEAMKLVDEVRDELEMNR